MFGTCVRAFDDEGGGEVIVEIEVVEDISCDMFRYIVGNHDTVSPRIKQIDGYPSYV